MQTRSLWTRSLMAVGLALSLATPVNAWAAQPFGPPFVATATGVGVRVDTGRVGVGVNVGSHGGYNYGGYGYGYGYGYGHVRVRAHGRCGLRGGCHKRVRRCGGSRCGGRFVAGVRVRAGGCGGFRGCGMKSGRRFSLRINIRGGGGRRCF